VAVPHTRIIEQGESLVGGIEIRRTNGGGELKIQEGKLSLKSIPFKKKVRVRKAGKNLKDSLDRGPWLMTECKLITKSIGQALARTPCRVGQ